MGQAMRRCKNSCGNELPTVKKCETIFQRKGYCDIDCLAEHTRTKNAEADRKKAAKAMRKAKERVKPRREWLDKLQTVVNQYVQYVKDKGAPCCTCGSNNTGVKYDAGHCFTKGARSDLRYELTNIHRQCSQYCNVNNSGFQGKHKEFIAAKYGADHLAKLEDHTQWPTLKETFPTHHEIKAEIVRYRKLLRDNGLTPNV
jgi:hypothetical protein